MIRAPISRLWLAGLLLLISSCGPSAFASGGWLISKSQNAQRVPITQIASLKEGFGKVDVQRVGDSSFTPLKRPGMLFPGDIVRTKPDSRAKVVLLFGDGSEVKLLPATRIELYPYYKGARSAFILFRVIDGGVQPKHLQAGSIALAKDSILTGAS